MRLLSLFCTVNALCVAVVCGAVNRLPSYISPCSRNEVNLNACALKAARAAIPKFIDGDRKYRIPPLDPMHVTQLQIDEGVLGLNMTVNNADCYGLRQAVLEDIEMDLKNKYARYQISIPRVEIKCGYEVNGKILILPITGKGPGNITLTNVNLNYTYSWDLFKKNDGLFYVKPKNSKLVFDTSRLYIKLQNLFNGNKLLGDQMNVFMDENWRDLVKDIGPIIGEAISETMRRLLENVFDLVSYEQAFPDTPSST